MNTRSPFPRPWTWPVGLLLSVLVCVGAIGCKGEKGRIIDAYEAAKTGGRKAAANQLRQDWALKKITLAEAVNIAHAKLDAAEPAAMAFAGGVLDTIALTSPKYRSTEESAGDVPVGEVPWGLVGALAAKSGQVAAEKDDFAMANTLVLAGSDLWESEDYWAANDAHDALASMVLHKSGKSQEAIDRLKSRAQLGEKAQEALDTIEREWRKARGG